MKKFLLLFFVVTASFNAFAQDFSNKGTDFWLGYAFHTRYVTGSPVNGQQMVLYFATDALTNVTVSIPALGYSRSYTIPANTIFTSQALPKTGAQDSRLVGEGLYDRGIHITSDKPVVAYAHIYNGNVSGATLLFPTNTLGKEYYSMNYEQISNEDNSNSFFFVVAADTGTTTVEITPAAQTLTHPANVPFTVTLTQGQIYNVMGALFGGSSPSFTGADLSGSRIRSINSGSIGCKKIAVFAGSGKIRITCRDVGNSSDNLLAQAFPKTAWGKKYLTTPTQDMPYNYYRVGVSDPTTVVKVDGAVIAGLNNNFYYDLPITDQPQLIEADQPIMVAQYITTSGSCGNNLIGANGDPEMIYLSPTEQTIDKVILNSTPNAAITEHWVNVVIKTNQVNSFTIDGGFVAGSFVVHPQDPTYSYAQLSVRSGQHVLEADSGFNAIAYGYGNAESYGYNAGTNLRDLYNFVAPLNPLNISGENSACACTPFFYTVTYPFQPLSLAWDFKGFQTPNVTISNPVADTTYLLNGKQVWRYKLPTPYTYCPASNYPLSITAGTAGTDGCGNFQTKEDTLFVRNTPSPYFILGGSGCLSDSVRFIDSTVFDPNVYAYKWNWDFGDGTTSTLFNPAHLYTTAGTYTVKYSLVTNIGCISTVFTRQVTVTLPATAKFGISTLLCTGRAVTFSDSSRSVAPAVITKWVWNYGDGTRDTVLTNANQVHTYATAGVKTATLKVLTGVGCESLVFTKTFTVNPNPVANFNLPASVCLPYQAAQFTDVSTIADGSQAGFTWTWNFGEPASGIRNTSAVQNPSHNYGGTGPFIVKLTVTSNAGCIDDSSKTLSAIYPKPTAGFTVNPENCFNSATAFTSTSNGQGSTITNWFWDFGDGTATGSGQNPTHTYTTTGSFSIKHWIQTDKGCLSDTITHSVVVNALPVAAFNTAGPYCTNTTIRFTNASTAGIGTITNWEWNLGDGTVLNLTNGASFTHPYTTAGPKTVSLRVTNSKGCVSILHDTIINIRSLPVPNFTHTPVCLPDGISNFTNTSSVVGGAVLTYAWNFGDAGTGVNNVSTLTSPSHYFSTVGPYSVMLTATSADGCVKDTIKTISDIYPRPDADFAPVPENCVNTVTTFTDQSSGSGSTITEWHWDFGDGQLSTVQSPTHTYTTPGSKTVTLWIKTNRNCISDTATRTVVINALPTAYFSAAAASCLNKAVTFTDTSKANSGTINTWAWNFGDAASGANNTSALQNPTHSFSTARAYTVTLKVTTDKGCTSTTLSKSITVNRPPNAGFISPEVCLNDPFADFTDTSSTPAGSTITNWRWDFGNPGSGANNVSTLQNPQHRYSTTGNYTATLIVTNSNGCTDTTAQNFTVNGSTPVANFAVANPANGCSNDSVSISDASSISFGNITKVEIYWDNGGAPTIFETDQTPVPGKIYKHLYPDFQTPATTTYAIRYLSYSGATCVNSITKNVTLNARPKVQIAAIPDVCLDATPFAIAQATVTGAVTGPPGAAFSGPGITATGLFDPAAVGAGTYTIRYKFTTAFGCTDSTSGSIKVLAPAVANFTFTAPRCERTGIDFTSTSTSTVGTLTSWTWKFGDGTADVTRTTAAAFTHVFADTGTYSVTLTVSTSNGCKTSVTKQVIVKPLPVPSFTFSPTACLPNAAVSFVNTSTIKDGTQNAFTYAWNFGDPTSTSNTSTSKTPAPHIYTTVGPYSVKLTVTSGAGCVHDSTIVVNTIHPQPMPDFTSDSVSLCVGQSTRFTDNSNGADGTLTKWLWDFGNGQTFNGQVPPLQSYNTAQTYTVKLQVENSFNCSNTISKPFTVYAYPVVNAGLPNGELSVVLEGGELTIPVTAAGTNLQYLWTPNTFLSNNRILQPVVRGLNLDYITYKLTATGAGGCSASDTVSVILLRAPIIPNTFTPNADGYHDFWVIEHLNTYPDCKVQVFNRYGQPVFESHGYPKPWDGNYKGKSLPFGTYYYVIEPGSGRKPLTGYVTIIK